jgi:hypothetical protein
VGPQNLVKGAVVTDTLTYTPITGGFTVGNGTITGRYHREGQFIVGDISFTSGTTSSYTTSTWRVSLPAGLQPDLGLLSGGSVTPVGLARGQFNDGTDGEARTGVVLCTSSSPELFVQVSPNQGNYSNLFWNSTTTGVLNFLTSTTFQFSFKVPIQGWSSNLTLSEDGGTREVAMYAAGNGGQSISVDGRVFFNTVRDTTSSWNGSVYVVPETGTYDFSGKSLTTTSASGQYYLLNETLGINLGYMNIGGVSTYKELSISRYLTKGHIISIRLDTANTLSNIPSLHYLTIAKLSSPQTLAGSETVAVRAVQSSGQSIPNDSVPVIMVFDSTKTYDTHNSLVTSTGIFTAPSSGKYQVNQRCRFAGASWNAGNEVGVVLYKDTGGGFLTYSRLDIRIFHSSVTQEVSLIGGDIIQLAKGEKIAVGIYSNRSGGASTLSTLTFFNFLSITKVGE